MPNENYKHLSIKLVEKTNNPIAPFAERQFENGVEKWANVLTALSDKQTVNTIIDRLLKDFSKEELETITNTPSFMLALLGIIKQSTIDFTTKL